MAYAAAHPERVAHLVLIDTAPPNLTAMRERDGAQLPVTLRETRAAIGA